MRDNLVCVYRTRVCKHVMLCFFLVVTRHHVKAQSQIVESCFQVRGTCVIPLSVDHVCLLTAHVWTPSSAFYIHIYDDC